MRDVAKTRKRFFSVMIGRMEACLYRIDNSRSYVFRLRRMPHSIEHGRYAAATDDHFPKRIDQSHVERREAAYAADVKDRKSTRLNSSHSQISYAVFCLKKKKNN